MSTFELVPTRYEAVYKGVKVEVTGEGGPAAFRVQIKFDSGTLVTWANDLDEAKSAAVQEIDAKVP